MSKDVQLNWDHSIQGFTMQGHGDSTIRLHTTGHDDVISPDFWVGLGLQNMNARRLHKCPHNSLHWEHIRKQYGRYGFSKPGVRYQDWETFSASADNPNQTIYTLAVIEENPTSAPYNSRIPVASLRTWIHSMPTSQASTTS